MKYFIVFKKQEGEQTHPYSLVDFNTLQTIPQDIIFKQKEVADRLYSTEELDAERDALVAQE